jgi:hypothetical protein
LATLWLPETALFYSIFRAFGELTFPPEAGGVESDRVLFSENPPYATAADCGELRR